MRIVCALLLALIGALECHAFPMVSLRDYIARYGNRFDTQVHTDRSARAYVWNGVHSGGWPMAHLVSFRLTDGKPNGEVVYVHIESGSGLRVEDTPHYSYIKTLPVLRTSTRRDRINSGFMYTEEVVHKQYSEGWVEYSYAQRDGSRKKILYCIEVHHLD